jgi:chorismate dehydratase
VGSIFLFTKGKSLSELDGAKIALTNTSATSVHLLRILLERFEQVRPSYITMTPGLDQMLRQADAAMLIGDDAIRASWSDQGYRSFDLGQEWYLRTGLSMTFAVWAVRKEIAEHRWSELEKIYDRFRESLEKSRRNLLPVIQYAMNKLGGTESFWQNYFRGLSHDLGEKEIVGLETYYRYAAELGFLKEGIKVDTLDKIVSMNT